MMIAVISALMMVVAVESGTPTIRPSRAPTAPTMTPTTASPTIPAGPPTIKEFLNYLMFPLNSTACTGPHFVQANLIDSCFYHASSSSYSIWASSGQKVAGQIQVTETLYSDNQCQNAVGTPETVGFTTYCTAGSYWNYRYAYQSGHEPLVPYLAGIRTDTYVGLKNCQASDWKDIVYSYYKCHNACVNRQLFFNCSSSGYVLRQYTDAQCKTLNFQKTYTLSSCSIAPTMNNQYIQASCFGGLGISGGGLGKGGQGVPRLNEALTGAGHWTPSVGGR